MIRFACPRCQVKLEAPEAKAGATISCPRCHQPPVLPVALPAKPIPAPRSASPPARDKATRPIICPGCGREIALPVDELGTMIECARCDTRFLADLPSGAQVPSADSRDDGPLQRRRPSSSEVVGFVCPYCGTDAPPDAKSEISQAGWIVFFILLLSVCGIVFCWIGLLLREVRRVCSQCGIRLGG